LKNLLAIEKVHDKQKSWVSIESLGDLIVKYGLNGDHHFNYLSNIKTFIQNLDSCISEDSLFNFKKSSDHLLMLEKLGCTHAFALPSTSSQQQRENKSTKKRSRPPNLRGEADYFQVKEYVANCDFIFDFPIIKDNQQ
jgi:hypothetical protein